MGLCIGIGPADPGHRGIAGLVALPEAAEGEGGSRHFLAAEILAPLQSHGLPQLMGDAQTVQDAGIQCDLIRRLGHLPGGGGGIGMPGVGVIGPADLHRLPSQLLVFRKAQHDAAAQLRHIRVTGDQVGLLLGQSPHGGLGIVTGLAEGHLHQVAAHALGQGEQGGEHHSGEQDRQNCHQIPAPVRTEHPFGQYRNRTKDQLFFHTIRPPYCATIRPSSMRITRSAMAAISGLWVIITMVW